MSSESNYESPKAFRLKVCTLLKAAGKSEGLYVHALNQIAKRHVGYTEIRKLDNAIPGKEVDTLISLLRNKRDIERVYGKRFEEITEADVTLSEALQRAAMERAREANERYARRLREAKERKERELEKQRVLAEKKAAKRAKSEQVIARLRQDFIAADAQYASDLGETGLSIDEYQEIKVQVVKEWASKDLGANWELSDEQALAVATVNGDAKVTARAGSGKTHTLVTRVLFLVNFCGISVRQIMLLVFNRDAALQVKARIKDKVVGVQPHVMTFHALSHALVHPEEELLMDDSSVGNMGQSRFVQKIIDRHVRENGDSQTNIKQLMLSHFRDDWEKIVAGRYDKTKEDFLKYRRSLPRETLNGEYVKSYGERLIANTLFEHGVSYKYERSFRWGGINYRPDFTVTNCDGEEGGVIIEYFGLMGDPDYDEDAVRKRDFWRQKEGWTLLEYVPNDVSGGEEVFVKKLCRDLDKCRVETARLSEDEVWELVKERALGKCTQALKTFVARSRKSNLTVETLRGKIAAHESVLPCEELFLEVGALIYNDYIEALITSGYEDFDGLILKAIDAIDHNCTKFKRDKGRESGDLKSIRYLMIDEFQDFSAGFFSIVKSVRSKNPDVTFFCVGDDWQAINGFAGSDVTLFNKFKEYSPSAADLYIGSNFRSSHEIVQAGNSLMRNAGRQACSSRGEFGWVYLCDLVDFSPTAVETDMHGYCYQTAALLRIIGSILETAGDVILLARTKASLPWYIDSPVSGDDPIEPLPRFLEHVRSFLPEEDRHRVRISTVHSYKGLECESVILLDAFEGKYPLLHPTWIFMRIFGDSIESLSEEEKRLFYVAISRAKDRLAIITESSNHSVFVELLEIQNDLDWSSLDAVISSSALRFEVNVSGPKTFERKEQIKRDGFKWNPTLKAWYCVVPLPDVKSALGFVTAKPWFDSTFNVDVRDQDGCKVPLC